MKAQEKVLDKLVEAWDSFIDLPIEEKHPDDTNDFRFHIHALQDRMYRQMYQVKEKEELNNKL